MRDNLGGSAGDYDMLKDYYEVEAGNSVAWDQLIAMANDPDNYQVLLGNHPDGKPDPSNERLLNPENLIDYIINIAYNNPWDWDNHNWMAARRRTNSDGFHFLVWDAESGLTDGNKIDWILNGGYENRPSSLFSDLMQNQQFRDLFISRVNRNFFKGGALTPEPGLKRYKMWLEEIDTANIADQARWYADEGDIWNISLHSRKFDYFPDRTESVFNQFIDDDIYPRIDMPEFNSDKSYIPTNFLLMLTGPEGAEIRYTMDDSDPGYYTLAASGSVMVYQDNIPLPEEGETFTVSARTRVDTLWSPVVKKTFTVGEDPTLSVDNSLADDNYLQCYPNPLQDFTNIEYILSEPGNISLTIYNATGEHVTTLELGPRPQGEHIVRWDSGNTPPGVYICVLYNFSNSVSQRTLLIKTAGKSDN